MAKKKKVRRSKGTIYVGIDPGMGGAVAAIFPDGVIQMWHTDDHFVGKRSWKTKKLTPSGKPQRKTEKWYKFREMFLLLFELRKLQQQGYTVEVGIELQNIQPGDQVQTGKVVGRNQGVWEALCGANRLKYRIIAPSDWKPRYVVSGGAKDKTKSIEACQALYEVELPRVKDEACAEAILMADYMWRKDTDQEFPRQRAKPRKRNPAKGANKHSRAARRNRRTSKGVPRRKIR